MTYNTINNDVTMAGGAQGALLAGRYRVVRQLGAGGMGSVWLAEDTQLDNKQFAIKMLPSILVSNKRAYRQLKDEALVAMKLTHPNIVTLRAFEENNGNPFLVMDYIDGETLDTCFTYWGVLDSDETVAVLKPIAAALDYAHSKGVVHRDVKPGNVMVARDGTPYILDFGIAREIQETMTHVTGKLSSGTLLYMSPEQLHGAAPKPAQDIYSFAVMAYECMKGEPPFCRGQIEYQIDNDKPKPLIGRDGNVEPLSASVMAGLAKKPEDRPKTCMAVLSEAGFSRVEHVERVEGKVSRRGAESQSGGARRLAEPVGSRVPRDRIGAPQPGDGFSREESKGFGGVFIAIAAVAAIACGVWFIGRSSKPDTRSNGSLTGGSTISTPTASAPTRVANHSDPENGDCKTITLPGGATMEMIYVAPGSFTMGSPESEEGHEDNEKQHYVTLTKGFWLGKYEVTQRQWKSVMGNNPSDNKGDELPVGRVSWDDCQEFIRKVNASLRCGARLPTEAEWEYACRAGTRSAYSWGNALNGVLANCDGIYPCGTTVKGPYKGQTVAVDSYQPNAWGFYNMHGNVSEWCNDWYGEYPSGSVTDPAGAGSASGDRVLRGGNWDNFARGCRSANRDWCYPGNSSRGFGFRLCCSARPRGR